MMNSNVFHSCDIINVAILANNELWDITSVHWWARMQYLKVKFIQKHRRQPFIDYR